MSEKDVLLPEKEQEKENINSVLKESLRTALRQHLPNSSIRSAYGATTGSSIVQTLGFSLIYALGASLYGRISAAPREANEKLVTELYNLIINESNKEFLFTEYDKSKGFIDNASATKWRENKFMLIVIQFVQDKTLHGWEVQQLAGSIKKAIYDLVSNHPDPKFRLAHLNYMLQANTQLGAFMLAERSHLNSGERDEEGRHCVLLKSTNRRKTGVLKNIDQEIQTAENEFKVKNSANESMCKL